ncbi:aminotransferase class IV [Paenibacillus thermotolerans]|uniref:aminotransferase class IV n=1 Tax=Paenibacillus thermotolerans TaxID=3027807 RepID=UPI002368751C|nr:MULTISPECIES: aminotransferase class IV [unclassified Paenibacillus]
MKLWLNGRIINEEEAVIPVSDHGFLYGMGLFETFRTYGGEPFLLERHAARLADGCRALRFAWKPNAAELRDAVAGLLAANSLEDAYVRVSVSAGAAPLGLPGPEGYSRPNVIMHMKRLPPEPSDPMAKAKALVRLDIPRSSPEQAVRMKSFQYMNNIFGKWELLEKQAGNAEGLFLNEEGYVCEGLVSNVFFVDAERRLATPSLETGCLPGVTRDYVMELAVRLGLEIAEGLYRWERLTEASEVFVTNSIQEIAPVLSLIDEKGRAVEVSGARPGEVTLRLMDAYKAARTEGLL